MSNARKELSLEAEEPTSAEVLDVCEMFLEAFVTTRSRKDAARFIQASEHISIQREAAARIVGIGARPEDNDLIRRRRRAAALLHVITTKLRARM